MKRLKKPLLFALCLVPIAAVAGIFSGCYQLDVMSEETINQAIEQFGSTGMLILITMAQTILYTLVCGFFGYLLADAIGLWKPVKPERRLIFKTLIVSALGGVLVSLDYWTFGSWIEGIQESDAAGLTVSGLVAGVLYGGVVEELMLRLFFMSLIALILWKLFFRKYDRAHIPAGVYIAANIIAAVMFAAGHIPASIGIFGALTPLILVRCFLLNGAFALLFGRLYRKYGILYAMTSHAMCHIASKLIWWIFI